MRARYFDFDPNEKLILAAVFILALTVRVIFVFQWSHTPYGTTPLLDARLYNDWAQSVAEGQLLRSRAFYPSPLYPYVLGALYSICGYSLLLAGLFNAFLGALTATLLSGLTRASFGWLAGAITGLLAAFYRPLIFYTAPTVKEPLLLLLFAVFLIFAFRLLKRNQLRDVGLCGAVLGVSVLARGNALLLAPIIIAAGFFKWGHTFLKSSLLFIVIMVLCIVPATLHNYIVSHDFVLLNYDDGFNFYVGNSSTANGANKYPPEISTDPVKEELGTMWEAREAYQHEVKPSEVSAYWRNRALDFILHNPLQDLVLLKNKFLAFWNNAEIFDSYDIDSIRHQYDTIISAPLLPFWPIACLAAFGAVVAWASRREDVILLVIFSFTYMASVLLFYVTDRYRLPIVIFLLPLAGAAIPCGMQLIDKKAWSRLIAALTLMLGFLILSFETSVAMSSETLLIKNPDAQVFIQAALIEQSQGHAVEAEKLLRTAMELYPADGVIEYNYGNLKVMQGDLSGALTAFQKAILLKPSYVLSYYGQAKIYQQRGDQTHAIECLKQGLVANPSDPLLMQTLTQFEKN